MKFGRRGLSVFAVISLTSALAAGCSSGSETLRFVPSGGMANEAALAGDSKMVWSDVSYVVEGTLPEMPSEMASYVVQKKSAPTQELQDIAETFGLVGDVVEDPTSAGDFDAIFKSYRIGGEQPEDEAMWMYGDGHWWSWSYYPGGSAFGDTATSSDGSSGSGSSTDGSTGKGSPGSSEPCPPDDPDCVEREIEIPEPPSPPENLPSKNEVESLTEELLGQLGINMADVEMQAFADEWSSWSQTSLLIDGLVSPISWYFSFGEDAKLMSASGSMVGLKKSETYALADATEAVSRLGDYRYYGGYGAVEARNASVSSSTESTEEDPSSATAEPVPPETNVVTPDTTVENVQPIDDLPPVDETFVDVEPEKITITITSVKMSYTTMYEEDGKQTLMPAFTYSNKDGDVGTVIALSDDLFAFEEVTDTTIDGTEPKPEPAPAPEPDKGDPIPAEEAKTLIGLTEDEAMKVASTEGWEFRVAARDGEQYMLTTDYVMNRVNVTIVEGTVTEVTVG